MPKQLNEEKKLKRDGLYAAILKELKLKPAAKSPAGIAYFTTDHLRAIYEYMKEVKKCLSPRTR
jgi:cytochrome c1